MPDDLKMIVMQAADLPTIPTVAKKVVKALGNPNTTIQDLSKIISTDQALSARILKIANSAMYYCQKEIKSLNTAMSRIGFASLKSIVIAVSTKDIYKHFGEGEKLLWEHSVGVSLASQVLAQTLGGFKTDELFIGGLLHDIGKTLLNNKDNKKYSLVFQKVHEGGMSFIEAEQEVYGFTHAEVGSLLINKWNLPDILSDVIRFHHQIEGSNHIPQETIKFTALINLADLICRKCGIGYKKPQDNVFLEESPSTHILGLNGEQLSLLTDQVTAAFASNKDIFL